MMPRAAFVSLVVCLTARAASASPECSPPPAAGPRGAAPSERTARAAASEAVACEWQRSPRDYRALVEIVDRYFERSAQPACQLLLVGAESRIALARQLESGAAEGPEGRADREEATNHWREGWDLLSGISLKWDQQGPTLTSRAAAAAWEGCVAPARDLLSKFPSMTVELNPPDVSGFDLRWDGVSRTRTLPRMLPGEHRLAVDAPAGYWVRVQLGDETLGGRGPHFDQRVSLTWMQRAELTVTFEPAPEAPKRRAVATRLDDLGPEPGFYDKRRAVLRWGGLGVALAAGGGAVAAWLHSASLRDDANGLRLQCRQFGAECGQPEEAEYNDTYDAADRWSWTGTGLAAVAGLGALSMTLSYFVWQDPEPGERLSWRLAPRWSSDGAGAVWTGSF